MTFIYIGPYTILERGGFGRYGSRREEWSSMIKRTRVSVREAQHAQSFDVAQRHRVHVTSMAQPYGAYDWSPTYDPVDGKLAVICCCGAEMIMVPVEEIGTAWPTCHREWCRPPRQYQTH